MKSKIRVGGKIGVSPEPVLGWILETGFWNDGGLWLDDGIWID